MASTFDAFVVGMIAVGSGYRLWRNGMNVRSLSRSTATSKIATAAKGFGYGSGRIFTAGSSITGQGLDTQFEFSNNTWYRMVITGSTTEEITASIYDDARTTQLISVGFGHDLRTYSAGFRIGISQSMGFPDAPYPTDAAVDWVRLSGHAQLATVVIGNCDSEVPNPISQLSEHDPRTRAVRPLRSRRCRCCVRRSGMSRVGQFGGCPVDPFHPREHCFAIA